MRRRPALEPEEGGVQTRVPPGAGACGPQLRPRQRASRWIPGDHHEEMKNNVKKNKDERESLASLETSGLSHWGVVWAGWHSGFGIFKKYPNLAPIPWMAARAVLGT